MKFIRNQVKKRFLLLLFASLVLAIKNPFLPIEDEEQTRGDSI
jgi:uncharacterized protein (UPF0333 family)